MQSVRLNRLSTYVSLGLLLVPVIMAAIADTQSQGTALGISDAAYAKASLYGAALLVVLKGVQAVATIISQYQPDESAGRHGLATYVSLGVLVIPVVLATIADLQDDSALFGLSPESFGKASIFGGALLVLLKGAQAAVEIVAQNRWAAIEEPVPTEGGANEPPTP